MYECRDKFSMSDSRENTQANFVLLYTHIHDVRAHSHLQSRVDWTNKHINIDSID